jgi:phenylalanyl-tRNA synthetase alpha chain
MDIDKTIKILHPLERKVLPFLDKHSSFNEIVGCTKLQEVEVMRALQWLQNKEILKLKEELKEVVELDKNGRTYLRKGLPERSFLNSIKEKPLTLDEIQTKTELDKAEINIALGVLRGKAAIEIHKKDNEIKVSITEQGKKLLDKTSLEEDFLKKTFPLELKTLKDEERFALENLKKRREIIKVDLLKLKFIELTEFGKEILKQGIGKKDYVDALTPEIVKSGSWKKKEFRAYDLKAEVPRIYFGRRHFVNQAVRYARKIWLDMGFKEMEGPILNTAFWNFDALFVPQDHPAREMQDTFFIENPTYGKLPDKELVKKVKETHENGWTTKSKGWQYQWNENAAKLLLPRTHTTVLSSLTLAKLKKEDLPAKFFAIGRCYRNEALDWSHLFEFNQTEGIVIDENVNLRHLMGYLREFAKKMGYPKIRFRPAYFPYTEPSLEGDVYDPVHDKWIEFIAAGIFRPEVVKPLLGKEIPVLAWGPGLDRMISSIYGLTDIRDLYKNDIKQLREIKELMK